MSRSGILARRVTPSKRTFKVMGASRPGLFRKTRLGGCGTVDILNEALGSVPTTIEI